MPLTRNQRYRLHLLKDQQLTIHYDFANDMALTSHNARGPTLALTRTTEGRYFDSSGVIQTAASGAARFDHDPVTGESLGLIVESTRSNLALQSEVFATTWTSPNSTVQDNALLAPDGETTADSITEASDTGKLHEVQQADNSSGTTALTYSFSTFAKAGTRTRIKLSVSDNATGSISVIANLSAGTIGTPTKSGTWANQFASIQALINGWYRITITGDKIDTNDKPLPRIMMVNDSDADTYNGDGTSLLYIWGAQLEVGGTASTYIPTTTSSVNRNVDAITTLDMTEINQIAGTFYIRGKVPQINFTARHTLYQLSKNSGTDQIWVEINANSTVSTLIYNGSFQMNSATTEIVTADTTFGHCLSYEKNNGDHRLDGGAANLDTVLVVPTDFLELSIGARWNLAAPMNGTIAEFRYYNERLDAQFISDLSAGLVNAQ